MKKEIVENLYEALKKDDFDRTIYGDRNEILRFYKNLRRALFLNCYFENISPELLDEYLEISKTNLKNFFDYKFEEYESKI